MFASPDDPITHCVEQVNGLAFAWAAKACGWGFLFRNLLVLPVLPSIHGLCLEARNPKKIKGEKQFLQSLAFKFVQTYKIRLYRAQTSAVYFGRRNES